MAQSITLKINGQSHTVQAEPDVPLLWVIREYLQLSGTKFGCGIAQCGACTVHVDGQPMRSCQLQVSRAVGREITTIEGIREDHPVKQAWIDIQVPQCGYCQSGQIMSAVALVRRTLIPARMTSSRPWKAICAAVGPTPGSSRPFIRRPRR